MYYERIDIEIVRKLSQEEGMTDKEIAENIGSSRSAVARARGRHGIPRSNRMNRKDKKEKCVLCGYERFISRKQYKQTHCHSCRETLLANRREKQRGYARAARQQK